MRGGRETAPAALAKSAEKRVVECIMMTKRSRDAMLELLMRGFEQVVSWFSIRGQRPYTYTVMLPFCILSLNLVADSGDSHRAQHRLSSSSSTGGDGTIQPKLTTTVKLHRVSESIKPLP
jgi:hypothetical protein